MICITFDTDHMSNVDMERFLEICPFPGKGTFFAHSFFDCLDKSKHEIGPHPFVNDLSNWREALKLVEAPWSRNFKGIRTHSCVTSNKVCVDLNDLGYLWSSNVEELFSDNLAPYRHPWGIWELPIYYMDNMDFSMVEAWPGLEHEAFQENVITQAVNGDALYIFDFHPLHLALNTRSSADYIRVQSQIFEEKMSPFDLTFEGRGVRIFFNELCSAMQKLEQKSYGCSEALEHFIENSTKHTNKRQ